MTHQTSKGINIGIASQDIFPFKSPDYKYSNRYLKIEIWRHLAGKGRFKLELLGEPSVYFSRHQLLNKYFVQPSWGDDYLEQRVQFTQERSFTEVALNIGVAARFELTHNISIYMVVGSGPMFSGAATERLNRGFMFSDIAGSGFAYNSKNIIIDVRIQVRHNSNADLASPNLGHNSVGIEFGLRKIKD